MKDCLTYLPHLLKPQALCVYLTLKERGVGGL